MQELPSEQLLGSKHRSKCFVSMSEHTSETNLASFLRWGLGHTVLIVWPSSAFSKDCFMREMELKFTQSGSEVQSLPRSCSPVKLCAPGPPGKLVRTDCWQLQTLTQQIYREPGISHSGSAQLMLILRLRRAFEKATNCTWERLASPGFSLHSETGTHGCRLTTDSLCNWGRPLNAILSPAPPHPPPQVLGLEGCTTTPGSCYLNFWCKLWNVRPARFEVKCATFCFLTLWLYKLMPRF